MHSLELEDGEQYLGINMLIMLISVIVRSISSHAKWVQVGQYLDQMEGDVIGLHEYGTLGQREYKSLIGRWKHGSSV